MNGPSLRKHFNFKNIEREKLLDIKGNQEGDEVVSLKSKSPGLKQPDLRIPGTLMIFVTSWQGKLSEMNNICRT